MLVIYTETALICSLSLFPVPYAVRSSKSDQDDLAQERNILMLSITPSSVHCSKLDKR